MNLKIATSQFAISSNITANLEHILTQMAEAKSQKCELIHFPEGSLSGYAGVDFISFEGFDWKELRRCTEVIMSRAQELEMWVLLGSAHPLSNKNKPHNSLYIINSFGQILNRYDKLFCAGDDTGEVGDLLHYSPGNQLVTFEIKGVKCGVLICHDYRYPELYRELKKKDVAIIFHSYHAGNMDAARLDMMQAEIGEAYYKLNPGTTFPEITMPATMISYAANNYTWISCSNTSAPESCWGAFMVRPDGVIVGRLEKNKNKILVTKINTTEEFYDSTKFWRKRAMDGLYFSGEKVQDPRSDDRQKL